ncbi:MAG TPA: arginine--tRNA ligase, partial [Candidatus Pristimantibacillus sp.]|nr:arginine--tRNA ligase [Candidatus Pristimantibacillus sp.]
MEEVQKALESVIQNVFNADVKVELTRPDPQFGDYATNVALQLAGRLARSPREVGEELANRLREALGDNVHEVTVAGPGFVNIRLSDKALVEQALAGLTARPQDYQGQVVVTEYSDPNPFKVLHAGHLYTSVVGQAISNLIETAGGQVHRVNFGGDVGLHVGKTMWAILQELGGEHPEKLADLPEDGRSEWMAKCYVAGTNAYEQDETAKAEIIDLNKRVYQLFADDDHDSPFAHIYWTCRQWSYDYFNAFYERIGTPFERYYPESETAPVGLRVVREQLEKGVYQQSDGAVIF